jgi:TldD protein
LLDFEELIVFGMEKGADFIDIRFEESYGTAIKITDSQMKVGSTYNNRGLGIRAFINGGWGFVSSNILEKENLRIKIAEVVKMAKLVSDYSKIKFQLKNIKGIRKKFPLDVKIKLSDVDLSEKITFLENIDTDSVNYDDRIVNTNSIYSDNERKVIICNSFGSYIEVESSSIFCLSANYSKEGDNRQRGYKSIGSTRGYETIETEEAVNLGENASKEAIELLTAKPAKGGTYKILLDPKLTGVFIHEAFGHSSEADIVLASESILENKVGEKIGSNILNIVDDPTLEGSYGSYRADDEGQIAQENILVKDGVLKNYIHNLETASRLDMKGNNGRVQNFRHYPIVRMSNTYILPGDWKFEEMLGEIQDGIYAEGWKRGYTDPATGAFMFKCAKAHRVENGEIKELLRDAAISGDTLTTLKNIQFIGKNLEFSPGHCGKSGQMLPVTDGGPHILVKNLVFGGLK